MKQDSSRSASGKRRCLVVDDSMILRTVIRHALEPLKLISFQEAKDGLEAWKLLETASREENPFDLVICDRNMPGMSGQELLVRIRAENQFTSLPFVMVTMEAEMDKVMEAIRSGATYYVTKPVSASILREKVATILDIPQR